MRARPETIMLFVFTLLPCGVMGQAPDPGRLQPADDFSRNVYVTQMLSNAQQDIRRGDLAGARAVLRQAVALDERHKPARKALIQLLLAQGEVKEAEEQAQIFARLHPEDIDAYFLRALAAFQNGRLPEASELAEACLKRGDRRGEVHKLLALSAYLQRRLDEFETHIREAAKLDPLDPDPHYHLGRYYFEEKRYEQALGAFGKAVELQPDHFKSRYYAGLVHEGQNDIEAAKQEMQAAIQIIERMKVRYAWPLADLGRLLVNEGDYDRGVGWLYRAIRNDPESPYARYHYARALFRQGATFEVKQELMEVIKLDPGYGDAYYLLARYYQKTGEKNLAEETFAKFEEVKKNPNPSPYGVRRW
jgi:tetratricopeptide (TPR) repeat protein